MFLLRREGLCPNAADDKIRCVWTGPAKDLEKHMEQCKSKAEFQEMTARQQLRGSERQLTLREKNIVESC
jgi:hypothetical protein